MTGQSIKDGQSHLPNLNAFILEGFDLIIQ